MGIIDKMMGIGEINPWMVQRDEQGNYIIYPILMFPGKGYIAPDEAAAIRFTDRLEPIIGLGFGVFMLAGYFSDRYFLIAVISYFILISIINLQFVKNYPVSKRKYSWKYYAVQMNKKRSAFLVCLCILIFFLFGCMIVYHYYNLGDESTGYYIFAISLAIYCLFMSLLVLFYRIRSFF